MKSIAVIFISLCFLASACASPGGKTVFDVRDFGALGDGTNLDSPAVNRAIQAAAKAGGGTVFIPAGTYLCGSIHLTNNLNLHLDAGAVVFGAPQAMNAYDPTEPWHGQAYQDGGHTYFHNSLIWGENLTNVFITGTGMINGGGLVRDDGLLDAMCGFSKWSPANRTPQLENSHPPSRLGNKAIALKLCRNVLIRDITIAHGGHFAVLVTGCTDMTVDNVTMDTDRDGIDIDCCKNTDSLQLPHQLAARRRFVPQKLVRAGPERHHRKSDHRELPGLRFSGRHAAGRHDEAQSRRHWQD